MRKVSHALILTPLAVALATPPVVVAPLPAVAASTQSSWPADGTATDVISGHNGTLQGGTTYGAGAGGGPGDQAFSFPGPSSFISTDNAVGNFGTDDATIAFSIKTTASQKMELISKRPICDYSSFWDVRMQSSGKILYEVDGSDSSNYAAIYATRVINDGMWHAVTVTRRGPSITLSVDSTADGTAAAGTTASLSNTATMYFGQSPCIGVDGTVNLVGLLDDIKITETLVAASPKSSWPADGSTTDVISGHNGTLLGGATYGAGTVGGQGDQAFSFPGPSSAISTDNVVGNFGTDDATITFSSRPPPPNTWTS